MSRFSWSQDDIVKLEQYIRQGYPYKQIAIKLNRSYGAICQRAHRLGLHIKREDIYTGVGYKQTYGFLEIIELLPNGRAKCICHRCGGVWIGLRYKVKVEHTKSCGCVGVKHNICRQCNNISKKHVICQNCGHKIYKNAVSLYEANPVLADELFDQQLANKLPSYSSQRVRWQCKQCNHIWLSTVDNRQRGSGCPKCNESKLEKNTSKILDKYHVLYDQEKRFKKCRHKNSLSFDFYLPEYDVCIECQGIQHYPEKYKHSTFANTKRAKSLDIDEYQRRDQVKRDFCDKEGIRLIEIPYWKIKNIEDMLIEELNI